MYPDLPTAVSILFVVAGLAALAWSSDCFIDGASALARRLGVSQFIIGMVIIGFGTSAPELIVSAMSGASGHSNLSLGNAYGSCIFNILVILGAASLIHPIKSRPSMAFAAVPALTAMSLFSWKLLADGLCSRADSFWLLGVFAVALPAYCWFDQRGRPKRAAADAGVPVALLPAAVKLVVGLAVLIGSSHVLVWGAVDTARMLGVSELLIGLTVLAFGTSLPELASAVASARKGKHEFVLGNIVGSNFFNTLAVVGVAGALHPIDGFSKYVVLRDLPVMIAATVSIAVFGINWLKPSRSGRITRFEGVLWVAAFVVYAAVTVIQEM